MAKISDEGRQLYLEKIRPYRETIEAILKQEKELLLLVQKESEKAVESHLCLVDIMLNMASNYIIQNGVSLVVLKVKNEDALNDARKSLYKSIIYLEELVTNLVDVGFSEYSDKVEELAFMDSAQRYRLIRKMGLAIRLLENAYGDNTKWKWSFVELEGRYAVVAKNILDMRNVVTNTDPRSPDYEPTMYHLRLVRRLLSQAADRYRQKYEQSTNRLDDYKLGIDFLSALKRILVIFGDREEAEAVKKKIDIWAAKLDVDLKKQHQEALQKKT
jgi:hypothetical protein